MFVVNPTGDPDSGEELAFLNPTLSRPRGTAIQEEGCLSLPGLRADVRRPQRVIIEAWDLDGQPIRIDLDGFLARVVQHEFDHLEGRLFTDRLPDAASLEVKRDLELLKIFIMVKQSRGELPPEDDNHFGTGSTRGTSVVSHECYRFTERLICCGHGNGRFYSSVF